MLNFARGFSLIELMLTLSVMTVLTLLATPSLTTWMANNRVRATAEALRNALHQAQGEAIERSRHTAFVLTAAIPALAAAPAANAQNWYLQTLPLTGSDEIHGNFLRGDTVAQGLAVTLMGPALICFNSLGRLAAKRATGLGIDCIIPTRFVTYNLTAKRADRPLRIEVYLGGKVRLCDPARTLSTTYPDGCA